ncbi:hypothetical protein [Kosakonia pseudosacchari]|uniref:hypothetical protein n=1 Tax=Kosakonia pseudosacchari TaxID=1646340 RepID=UPI001FCA04AA|nr:hypothetical protein [Kosakonia pseudosacchari]
MEKMNLQLRHVLSGGMAVCLLLASFVSSAVTMNITASFSPSLTNPENVVFTDTTAQSGFCATWPTYCVNGERSLSTGLILTPRTGLTTTDSPQDSLYFKWPSSFQNVEVTNVENGTTTMVRFRVSSFSGRYDANSNYGVYDWGESGYAFTLGPLGGCNAITPGWLIGNTGVAWLWGVPEGTGGCYRITSVDRPVGDAKFVRQVNTLSFGYTMIAPSPLTLTSGEYVGTVTYTIGPGGDIDFGNNFQANDNILEINFKLSVNHDLKLTPAAGAQSVALQPCATGRVCSEDEGQANWERWMVTRVTPQLTGRSAFSLSSSGAFTVYLSCAEQSGTDCALKSDNSGQLVPVKTLLSLPDNIIDSATGASVTRKALRIGKDMSNNIFNTQSYARDAAGNIDFLVTQKDVDTMLKTRPDTYRGAVTVIFDPNLF